MTRLLPSTWASRNQRRQPELRDHRLIPRCPVVVEPTCVAEDDSSLSSRRWDSVAVTSTPAVGSEELEEPTGVTPTRLDSNKPSLRQALGVLRIRHYRNLWLSSFVSFTGMQMQQIARGVLAWDLTQSHAAVGSVFLSFGLPMLLFSLVGGATADRLNKRSLTMMTQGATGVLALVTALLVVSDVITIELLLLVGVVQGSFFSFGMPARSPLMALSVPADDLTSAMALSNAAMNATRLGGPAIAGGLIALQGVETAYFVQAALYVISVAILLRVPHGLGAPNNSERRSVFREIGAGVGYAVHHKILRLLLLMGFISAMFAMPYVILLPGFVEEDLGLGSSAFGILSSVTGVGALVGSLVVAAFSNHNRKPLIQFGCGIAGGLGLILLGVGSDRFGYAGALVAVLFLGLTLTTFQTLNMTMVMAATDEQYYGRINSMMMLTFSSMPVMAIPLGLVADEIGVVNLFVLQGLVVMAALGVVAAMNVKYTFGPQAG